MSDAIVTALWLGVILLWMRAPVSIEGLVGAERRRAWTLLGIACALALTATALEWLS